MTILLPRDAPRPRGRGPHAAVSLEVVRMSGPRLLIVDDEARIRDMLAFFFHKQGFEVMTAANFTEGVAAAAPLHARTSSCATSRCRTATASTS